MFILSNRNHAAAFMAVCLAFLLLGCAAQSQIPGGPRERPRVVFKFRNPRATRVSLVGDFNNWSPNAQEMIQHGDTWVAEVALDPGRYQYVFLVDGSKWEPDPDAVMTEDSGFGTKNSILIVE